MSKAKHTKGKWSVSSHFKTNENGAEYLTIDCFENGSGVEGLAVVYEGCLGEDSIAEMEANARLIAEAPTMYELLRQYAETMGVYTPQQKQFNSKVEELIKKIEG